VSIASIEFANAAATQAGALGLRDARTVFVAHPIQDATDDEMFATFNMGIGMVLLVGADDAERVLAGRGPHDAFRIGRVVEGAGVHVA